MQGVTLCGDSVCTGDSLKGHRTTDIVLHKYLNELQTLEAVDTEPYKER
jgi:hypothetical protein